DGVLRPAENGRGGPDAERERSHDRGREERRPRELTGGEAEVEQERSPHRRLSGAGETSSAPRATCPGIAGPRPARGNESNVSGRRPRRRPLRAASPERASGQDALKWARRNRIARWFASTSSFPVNPWPADR